MDVQEAIARRDRVLVFTDDFERREGGEQEVKGNNASDWTVRDGKIARWEVYADRAEALEAVGWRSRRCPRRAHDDLWSSHTTEEMGRVSAYF